MDTRTRLLETALRLFATRGYDATGVQDVVAAAGVTKPTLYHHFGSKTGLLDAVLEENTAPFFAALEVAARYDGDLPAALDRIAALYLSFAAERPAFYRLQLALSFAPAEHDSHLAVTRLQERQQVALERLFVRATENHGNMRGRHRRYAFSLVGTLNAYAALVLSGLAKAADPALRRDLVHQFSYGIYS